MKELIRTISKVRMTRVEEGVQRAVGKRKDALCPEQLRFPNETGKEPRFA